MSLSSKTIFITGASRGIGLAIAKRAACDGANIVIAAKTAEPHPKLPGTIYTAAEEIEEAGGQALPLTCDIRFEDQVQAAVDKTVDRFGGIDVCINNASAISLTPTCETDMKRYDLMNEINTRGTFLTSRVCIPHLKQSDNAHILNLAPPLDMDARWFAPHVAYTIAKMGMSLCTLGMAEELAGEGIAVNSLWPLTAIDTAAVRNVLGGEGVAGGCRTVDIMADAAYEVITRPSGDCTGNFYIDEVLLRDAGVIDFDRYSVDPSADLYRDFFVPESIADALPTRTLTTY
ncbi:short chain dehydrogenase [Luminiphilus syltensis NOR5-1B]|uniref:Short chain dehydrogenase n=1 Tax=Luminiphilus syltensis NOR5-1B TaxID=565045 RepID=B8KYN7_9GAMM|nr:NAD(P)-dependent oxidoreductase [Luminiphilus syltensis]EED35800.1 short chain dehydrogenase [Luminiphilus syltensis NOR5-1B]